MGDAPRKHSVENGVLLSTSVSAVKKLMTCEAAYWFRYVQGIEEPQGKGAELGTMLHAEVEHYLATGENEMGDIPRTGMHLLPAPGKDLGLEVGFGSESGFVLEAAGVPFKGYIDLVDERRVKSEGLLVITDHKFKGDPKKYGTTPARLKDPRDEDGIQMVGYAMAAYNAIQTGRFSGTKTIRLRHIHYATKQTSKKPIPAVEIFVDVPLADVPSLWLTVMPTIERMKAVAAAKDVAEVKGNRRACYKYGGCPHQQRCPQFRSKENQGLRLTELFKPKGTDMGFLNKVKPTSPAVPPAPVAVADGMPPKATQDDKAAAEARVQALLADVEGVLPPDAPASGEAAPKSIPAEVAPSDVEPISIPEKPKRTRRTKAEMQAAETESEPVSAPTAAPAVGGFTLCVGRGPTKVKALSFVEYVDALEQTALAGFREQLKLDVDDIRLSTGSDAGYGKWKAIIGALAKQNPPAPGIYVVPALNMDERVDAVFVALESMAVEVFR